MENDPKKYGCPTEPDTVSLISDQYIRRFLNKRGLGNYADDICQEMRCRLEKDKQEGKAMSWKHAFGILRNIARGKSRPLRQQRAHRKRLTDILKAGSQDSQTTCPAELATRKELIERIYKIRDELNWRQRIVFNLRCMLENKLTFKQIGQVIGFSESTAREEFHKACDYVRARLSADEANGSELAKTLNSETSRTDQAKYLEGENL